jgi:hypothetical protein
MPDIVPDKIPDQAAPSSFAPARSELPPKMEVAQNFKGLVQPGNIDLTKRPIVKNPDGSISTVRSISVNMDGHEVLIPTVSDDGKILSNEQAIRLYQKTGKHLGMFETPDAATEYAKLLHTQQEQMYLNGGQK